MRRHLSLLALTLAAGPLRADDPPKPADPAPAEFEAKFADDSTLKVTLLDSTLGVTTKYGKLTLPVGEIKRVELGFRFPPGAEARIDAAAADLGAPSFRAREEAEKALVGFAEYAVPAVRRAKKSTDPETARRADAVWRKLTDKLPADKLDLKDYDLIEAEFPVRGRIDPASLRVKSKYFGDSELRLAEVRGLRSMAVPAGPTGFALDAAKYGKQGWAAWMDTGLDVANDAPLEVTAGGQIDLNRQQPGQFVATPQGNSNGGVAPGIPNVVNGGFGGGGRAQRFMAGTVVGRIGSDGPPFLIGTTYRSPRAPGSGRLFLIVAPGPWGVDAAGEYQVKVKAGG